MLISLPIIIALESCEYLGLNQLVSNTSIHDVVTFKILSLSTNSPGQHSASAMVIADDNEKPEAARG